MYRKDVCGVMNFKIFTKCHKFMPGPWCFSNGWWIYFAPSQDSTVKLVSKFIHLGKI